VKKGVIFFVLILFLIFHAAAVSAQTQRDWWYTLERGKLMFRQGDYGNALLAFEDARRQRRVMYERLERSLINLLSITEVRRIGDSLDLVERYIQERRYADAADALAELYYRIPKESFNNSASAALTALGTLKDYPEAEYWIGETYLVEGELSLAMSQFQKAYALRGLLENPGVAAELLYKIAAICQIRQDYNEMERTLLLILSDDKLWSGGNQRQEGGTTPSPAPFETQSMTRTLENNGVERFLTLYRYRNPESADAHRLLGYYYYTRGRHSRAQEHLMFAFLIQNTVIIDEVIRNRFDFTFGATESLTAMEALAVEINRYPLIAAYAAQNEYYKTAYYLGASLYANGKAATARELWNFLAAQNNAGEWRTRSLAQLRNPRIESVAE
jgi:tetratricopeptide (TPR) repeat protein